MPLTLAAHFSLIRAETVDLDAHPLSARQAKLVLTLLDKFADRVHAAWRGTAPERLGGAADILAWRGILRERCPALGAVFDACAVPPAAELATRAVAVPIADYPQLSTADFMVSLYNGHTVQRVLLVWPEGTTRLAREVIGEALAWWQASGLAE
jgi:hypothetical protein